MWRRVPGALLAMLAVLLLPSTAWASTVDPSPTSDPSPSASTSPEPSPTGTPEPVPTETVTATVTAEPVQAPDAPGVNSGVYVDPSTGAVRMGERSAVALGVGVWLVALVAGLWTSWLVLP